MGSCTWSHYPNQAIRPDGRVTTPEYSTNATNSDIFPLGSIGSSVTVGSSDEGVADVLREDCFKVLPSGCKSVTHTCVRLPV
jgi:hypothetical protein